MPKRDRAAYFRQYRKRRKATVKPTLPGATA